MSNTTLARRHRSAQQALAATLTLDITRLWRALVGEDGPRPVWDDTLRPQLATLVQERRTRSAALALSYYQMARADAGVAGDPPVVRVPRAPAAQVDTALTVTGLVSYERAVRSGRTPDQASDTAIVTVTGAAERLVQDAGRTAIAEAVRRDDQAVAWYRLPGPTPCPFCAMLASRGAVYKTRETASVTEDGDRYHDHCACTPVPVFSRDAALPPEVQRWVDAWPQVTAGAEDPIKAWRAYVRSVQRAEAEEASPSPTESDA